jgi:hypothetical protein
MRVGLAILIAMIQLVGPWLCCCGPSRLVVAFAPVNPPEPVKSSCPHCEKECPKTAPKPKEQSVPKKPLPTDHCPCGGVVLIALPTEKTDRTDLLLAVLLLPTSNEIRQPVMVESVTPVSYPGRRIVPLLTAADRLYEHHVLRC